jgi:hypothetical protein
MWISKSLHCFLEKFQRSSLIPLLRDRGFQDFAFVVDSSPEIVPFAAYLHEDLVQLLPPLGATSHRFRSAFPDLVREVCAEAVDPEADTFVADINAALVQQVFNIPKRERKSDIHQYGELDDFGRGFEVAERVLDHFLRLNTRNGHLKSGSADNTDPRVQNGLDQRHRDQISRQL